MTSAVATTWVLGDIANVSGFTDGSGNRVIGGVVRVFNGQLNLAGRSHLTFEDFFFEPPSGLAALNGNSNPGSHHITFTRCLVLMPVGVSYAASIVGLVDAAMDWVFTRCVFYTIYSGTFVTVQAPTSATADYNLKFLFESCLWVGAGPPVSLTPSGALAYKPNGITIRNCTVWQGQTAISTAVNSSTTYPLTVTNSLLLSVYALNAQTLGQITENFNLILGFSQRVNVAVGVRSRSSVSPNVAWLFPDMYPALQQRRGQWVAEPMASTEALGFGSDGAHPAIDLLGRPRPCGTMTFGDSGTASAGTATTLTDSSKAWPLLAWGGQLWVVKITGGTGSGQVKLINSHTATALTVSGNWITTPDNTSTYTIYQGAIASSGTATAGTTTTLTDANAAWRVNQWTGAVVAITGGTGSGQTTTVTSNTATVLTVPTLATGLDNTSQYKLYRGTDENTVAVAAGALERGNTMVLQTAVVRTGTSALRAIGPAVQDFEIAVNPVATTVSVWVRWNSTYAGTKPQLRVINGEEAGVSEATATATGSADTWEQLTLTFTPARAGLVTVRLQANSTATLGLSYWDDATVTPTVDPRGLDHARRSEPLAFLTGAGGVSRSRLVNG